ncbi:MAG: hypothetical protein S4CHLAM20_08050 [Chlamydiia bacterium]|nr:hypothetical protein [Chlamydiia bacterium]
MDSVNPNTGRAYPANIIKKKEELEQKITAYRATTNSKEFQTLPEKAQLEVYGELRRTVEEVCDLTKLYNNMDLRFQAEGGVAEHGYKHRTISKKPPIISEIVSKGELKQQLNETKQKLIALDNFKKSIEFNTLPAKEKKLTVEQIKILKIELDSLRLNLALKNCGGHIASKIRVYQQAIRNLTSRTTSPKISHDQLQFLNSVGLTGIETSEELKIKEYRNEIKKLEALHETFLKGEHKPVVVEKISTHLEDVPSSLRAMIVEKLSDDAVSSYPTETTSIVKDPTLHASLIDATNFRYQDHYRGILARVNKTKTPIILLSVSKAHCIYLKKDENDPKRVVIADAELKNVELYAFDRLNDSLVDLEKNPDFTKGELVYGFLGENKASPNPQGSLPRYSYGKITTSPKYTKYFSGINEDDEKHYLPKEIRLKNAIEAAKSRLTTFLTQATAYQKEYELKKTLESMQALKRAQQMIVLQQQKIQKLHTALRTIQPSKAFETSTRIRRSEGGGGTK